MFDIRFLLFWEFSSVCQYEAVTPVDPVVFLVGTDRPISQDHSTFNSIVDLISLKIWMLPSWFKSSFWLGELVPSQTLVNQKRALEYRPNSKWSEFISAKKHLFRVGFHKVLILVYKNLDHR